MATVSFQDNMNVLEMAQLIGPDGSIMRIAEILVEINEFQMDAVVKMANGVRANVTAVRTDLPTIYPRKINQGATTVYPQTNQIEDRIMLLEAWPEIDEQLIDPMPDKNRARMSQLKAYIEGFAQSLNEQVFYGNKADVGEIDGLSTVYNLLAGANVRGAGGTGSDTASIWMMEHEEMKFALIYPKGSPGVGLSNKDWGLKRVTDSSNNPLAAYVSQMKMEFGWTNPDQRAVQRLANIESAGSTNNLLDTDGINPLVAMRNLLPRRGKGKVGMYANRDIAYQFDIWAMDKANGFYYQENISGGPLAVFQGIPIRLVEQLVSTEDAIS